MLMFLYTILLQLFLTMSLHSPPPNPTTDTPNTSNQNNSSVAPCGICDRTVGWEDRGVECETCARWFHASCQNIGSQSYVDLGASSTSWHCELCGAPNYSSVAFDLHGVEQETAAQSSPLKTNFSFNSNESFHPGHSSTPTRQTQQNKNRQRPLRILNVNFQSAKGKTAAITHLIDSLRPDILIGCETWLDPTISSSENFPPGYKIYRKDRNRHGGGVLIAVSDSLTNMEEPTLSHSSCEILWIKVKLKNAKDLLIGSYYRPHESDEPSLTAMSESLQSACNNTNSIVVLGGDFNFPSWDWSNDILKRPCSYPKLHYTEL